MDKVSKATTQGVDPIMFGRFLGITLLVLNHATPYLDLQGGLNVLLLISGISFAMMGFKPRTSDTLRKIVPFLRRLVVFSLLIAVFSAVVNMDFRLAELLLFSNWIEMDRVAMLEIWYVQVIVQIFLAVALIFWLFDLSPKIQRDGLSVCLALFVACVLMAGISKFYWDTTTVYGDRLPHLHAWNLVLGWVVWAVIFQNKSKMLDRVLLTLLIITSSSAMFYALDLPKGWIRIWPFLTVALLIIWVPRIPLGKLFTHIVQLINQATLTIFLLHLGFFRVVQYAWNWLDLGDHWTLNLLLFAAGMIGPILVWAGFVAATRVFWKMKHAPQTHAVSNAMP